MNIIKNVIVSGGRREREPILGAAEIEINVGNRKTCQVSLTEKCDGNLVGAPQSISFSYVQFSLSISNTCRPIRKANPLFLSVAHLSEGSISSQLNIHILT